MSYLQLPVKRREESHFCTRCGEMGHGKHYCQATTWCKFCTSDTHATQACRKYEKVVREQSHSVKQKKYTGTREEDSSKHSGV